MAADDSWISQNDLLRTDYAMLAFTSTIIAARIAVQVWRCRKFEWQDAWLYIAFAAYLAMCILFTHITPTFFKLDQLAEGEIQGWNGMQRDVRLTSEVIFTSGIMFWTCLWCVKFSLLALYKKLLIGVSDAWTYTYWSIVVFCVLTYVTCFITGPAIACDHPQKLFHEGELCLSTTEVRHQTASMYYAFAVDAVTNLMVMFLPFCLVMPTQMPRGRKIGVGILFGSGLLCTLFSTVRIVQITSRDGIPKSPDPKWLTMWTIIECSTAVVIGCCPMLAAGIPRSAKRADYDVHGYARDSASQTKGSRPDYTRMRSVESSLGPCEKHRSDLFWNDACESQEELALVPAPVRALLLMERGERQICPDGDRCRFYQQMRQLRSIP